VKKYINEMIKEYTNRPLSPWHMPGHKRKPHFGGFWDETFSRDLTEVPGTDDYHHPEGAIRDSQAAAAEVYGTAYSHYLVGGTTAGILAGILALSELYREKKGNGLATERPIFLVAGNVHRSVHHALRLAGADVINLEPKEDPYYGAVMEDEVKCVLDRLEVQGEISRVAGCVITSPSYGGAISPIKEIHDLLKKEGIPLFVDEAHGAHFPFIPELSEYSGICAGAELVVQSLHKTLPALTQTGIIHVGQTGMPGQVEILERELTRQLSVVQSSSPSYLLLASAEQAVAWADEHREEFAVYDQRVHAFRERLRDILSVGNRFILTDFSRKQDPTRIFLRIISGPPVSMSRIADHLEKEEGIVAELAGKDELILISTVADQDADFEKLLAALKRVSEKLNSGEFADAGNGDGENRNLQNAKVSVPKPGEVAKRDIYSYPPGILILREGDPVTEEAASRIAGELSAGRTVRGL